MDHHRLHLLYLLYLRKKKRSPRLWVHPLMGQRHQVGAFATLFHDLRMDDAKFFDYFGMSITTFDELLHKLHKHLLRENTKMRNSVQPAERLAVTIRYLASGNTFTDLHYAYRLGISTISEIVNCVCTSIWTVLRKECIPDPSTESLRRIAKDYEKKANFPHCIGSVDGKHIRVIKSKASASIYYDLKGYFSVVLMAVADSEYRFVYVDIGSYGKDSDPTAFSNSSYWKAIESRKFKLPEAKHLPHDQTQAIPYVLVGDKAFDLHPNLMRPYAGKMLDTEKRVYNYRLNRARRYVESTFGILSNKWKILQRPLNVSMPLATKIVQACCVLHNFVVERDGYSFEDTLSITGLTDITPCQTKRGNMKAKDIRQAFAQYFMSEAGSLPWQLSQISN